MGLFGACKGVTRTCMHVPSWHTGDVDGDGDVDVIGASYYDSTLRWFENNGKGTFTPRIISKAVNEGQGVTAADLDNDGDLDLATASSGDNTIAVFKNIERGVFCEIKEVVDNNATGARTVVAADLDGDGWLDLASASKDDNTVAWYRNNGNGSFPSKTIISQGAESTGAYSLVAGDIDGDGDQDLIVASNGNDHVSLWRNDGKGNFVKTLIYGNADFVLSVTVQDFDRDGDMDVASASFFDGYIRWYENLDGEGRRWLTHKLYHEPLAQGHYVSSADLDGDGDYDLIAVTHAENTVAVFLASTPCDAGPTPGCCATGTSWNGTACVLCLRGKYGVGHSASARCLACPRKCTVPGHNVIPATCSGISGCTNPNASLAACACGADSVKDSSSDVCIKCPNGQTRKSEMVRSWDTLANYSAWQKKQGVCVVQQEKDWKPLIISVVVLAAVTAVLIVALYLRNRRELAKADAVWTIHPDEITYDTPQEILGSGTFGVVRKGYYRGTTVAIKMAIGRARSGRKFSNCTLYSAFT